MAGWFSRLFAPASGNGAAVSLDPAPGEGGYAQGAGPTGQDGYPGSGITNKIGAQDLRTAKIPSDRDSGFEQGLGSAELVDASYRGDQVGGTPYSPRTSPRAVVSRRRVADNSGDPATLEGGMVLPAQPGAETVGGNPLSGSANEGGHSVMETQVPYREAWPSIDGNMPVPQLGEAGPAPWAERWKAIPGTERTGMSSTRSDNAPPQAMGWQANGEVHPELLRQDVTTTDRLVTPEITWAFDRPWPYHGDRRLLDGERLYYSAISQFTDGNMGQVGVPGAYQRRPTTYSQPAPWTGGFQDGTDVPDPTQQTGQTYVPPPSPRAGNGTGRR